MTPTYAAAVQTLAALAVSVLIWLAVAGLGTGLALWDRRKAKR